MLINSLTNKWCVILFFFSIVNIVFSQSKVISIYRWLKLFELLSLILIFSKKKLKEKTILYLFFINGTTQLVLSVLQFANRGSIQGIFYFIGERYFRISTPGIAKTIIKGVEILRPYGSFSHPNSMAGFYLLLYFYILVKIGNKHVYLKNFTLLISSLLVLLSFSKIAITSYVIFNVFYLLFNMKGCRFCTIAKIFTILMISLIFLFAQNDPFTVGKRIELINNAWGIIKDNILFGVGLGNYLLAQSKFSSKFYLFFNQPVHNIFLLLASEIGLATGILLLIFIIKIFKKNIIHKKYWFIVMVIFITGLFDHYWLTLQQNFILMGFVFGSLLENS